VESTLPGDRIKQERTASEPAISHGASVATTAKTMRRSLVKRSSLPNAMNVLANPLVLFREDLKSVVYTTCQEGRDLTLTNGDLIVSVSTPTKITTPIHLVANEGATALKETFGALVEKPPGKTTRLWLRPKVKELQLEDL